MNDAKDIKTKNAVTCRICFAAADLMKVGMFVCQDNPQHIGDTFNGIFTDLTMRESKETNPRPQKSE